MPKHIHVLLYKQRIAAQRSCITSDPTYHFYKFTYFFIARHHCYHCYPPHTTSTTPLLIIFYFDYCNQFCSCHLTPTLLLALFVPALSCQTLKGLITWLLLALINSPLYC